MPTATPDTRRGVRRGSWLAGGALVLTATAIFALTVDRSDPTDAPPRHGSERRADRDHVGHPPPLRKSQ